MSSWPTFHFKRAGKQNLKNANEAAEISFTIALYEEYEGAVCAIGMTVQIKKKKKQQGFTKL